MTNDDLESFLETFDLLCITAMKHGATGAELAGAVLARVQHLYLSDDQADLAGLERLLSVPLESIRNRPKFDIE